MSSDQFLSKGRKRKLRPEASCSGSSPPVPIIIIQQEPVVFMSTEKLFKDHVQLNTGCPKTQAAAAVRLACDLPSPSRSPPPIPDPSSVDAIVPLEVGGGGRHSQEQYFSNVLHDPSQLAVTPFRHNEDGHLAAATFYSASAYFVSDDATTWPSGGVPTAPANALCPPSSSSIWDVHTINSNVSSAFFSSSSSPSLLDNVSVGAAPTLRPSSQAKLAAGTPYSAFASFVSDDTTTSSGGVATAPADALCPPSSSSILDMHAINPHLMSDGGHNSNVSSAFTPSSSSLLDMKITNVRGNEDLIVTFPTGVSVVVSNGNVSAGAPTLRPSSPPAGGPNVVNKFLENDDLPWSWPDR